MKKIIFTNQKGGVGKSTTCRECGFFLASKGFKTLFIDCDPQGNLTKSVSDSEKAGHNPSDYCSPMHPGKGLFEALEDNLINCVRISKGLFLLAGDFRLSLLEKRYLGELDAYSRLQDLLSAEEFTLFDFILFDTPPSLNILTLNALSAADHLILPMKPSLYSMQGTNDLMNAVSKVKKTLNPDLSILGVIINEFSSIPVITRQIRREIEESFDHTVFDTVISKSIKVEEAIALKDGIINLSGSKVKIRDEVSALGDEILSRLGLGAEVV